ncbi:MAG TPA: MBOAT family O-acyltransferase [Myxococcota bacterium]|nr:MBOAT family O-acyltransferase [Myxococcota bacterium]
MSFVQWQFPVFFAAVLVVFWGVRHRRAQNAVLLSASLVFYGWVHPWFVLLILFSTFLDYGVGLAMGRHPDHKRWLLALSLTGNLGLLGVFKYFDFFLENVAALGLGTPSTLGILLPVGISFFTFQTMSYTFDVYRGKVEPRRDLLDYATYVCMFPQLVAGPIERARDLLPQVESPRKLSGERFASGLTLALWGAVQKVVVADTVGLYADRVFAMEEPGGWLVHAATIGFAVQILADFSGYTDIARGTARMLGFELRRNFDNPYRATSPSDFWKRWHISLSSWIHEYVYVPFGGSRRGPMRTALATSGALLLSGLWHGAAWHFVIWGGYHAALLMLYRSLSRRVPAAVVASRFGRMSAVVSMFFFTCVGWLIFRETSLPALAGHLVRNPFAGSWEELVGAVVVLSISAGGGLVLLCGSEGGRWLRRLWARPHLTPVVTTLWGLAVFAIFLFSRDTARDFIYFRF